MKPRSPVISNVMHPNFIAATRRCFACVAICLLPGFASAQSIDEVLKELISSQDCKFEYRSARSIVHKRFTDSRHPDIFVFFTTECDNQANFFLAIVHPSPNGNKLLAFERIGGLPLSAYGIDFGYVKVQKDTFFLRGERGESSRYGDLSVYPKVYFKWRLAGGKMVSDGQPYFLRRGKLVAVPESPN